VSTVSAYAPGRVELLGNHTDYNQGVVLAAAIDRGLRVTGQARGDEQIVLTSTALGRRVEVSLRNIERQAAEPWSSYALGVASEMLARGLPIGGFEAEVSGNLPVGGGLSSSAAFEVATALFICKLHNIALEPLELAKLCHRVENDFVGVNSGLLDQATSVFGRAGEVVFLDCRTEEIRTLPFPPDLSLVITNSGVTHSLVSGEYNRRRAECTAAAEALGVFSLREVSLAQVEGFTGPFAPVFRQRALHIAGENQRVLQALEALAAGDAPRLGALMEASHESSRVNFENSTPELDLLVQLAKGIPGVLGARLTGGGFGGSTVTLVQSASGGAVAEELPRRYTAETGIKATAFVTTPADGAR